MTLRYAFSHSGRQRRIERGLLSLAQILIVLYLLFSISDWLSKRELWRIDFVHITGVHAVTPQEVEDIVMSELRGNWYKWWMRKDNPVLYPRVRIKERIMNHSGWVKDVDLLADGKTLSVHIEEFVPEYIWCSEKAYATSSIPADTCWYGDERGEIFTQTPAYSGYPFPRIISSDRGEGMEGKAFIFSSDEFDRVKTFVDLLENEGVLVKAVEHLSGGDYVFLVNRPWSIFWESDADPKQSVSRLLVALESVDDESRIREFDLRFGDKIFVR